MRKALNEEKKREEKDKGIKSVIGEEGHQRGRGYRAICH